MSWSIGYDSNHKRDIGYGVPSICDYPGCNKEIHRGLVYVCGSEPYGGEYGCGLFFCSDHLQLCMDDDDDIACEVCDRCFENFRNRNNLGQDLVLTYKPKPDTLEWMIWKMLEDSWEEWRNTHPDEVQQLKKDILNRIDQ